MKIFPFLLILMLLPALSFAQNCEFSKNEIDDFTGNKVVVTTSKISTQLGAKADIYFVCKEGYRIRLWLSLTNVFYTSTDIAVKKGEEMFLKLENGEVVKLSALNDYETKTFNMAGTIIHYVEPEYEISKEDLEKLKNGLLQKVRIVCSGKDLDLTIKPKLAASTKRAAECFFNVAF